ncbi:MAG: TlpA family protein disulfide reductase [Alistipes sp.]|nr:TlpA family protein disulfide reductase [Alistipes sp.]
MKRLTLAIMTAATLLLAGCHGEADPEAYLAGVLKKLEGIDTAEYAETLKVWTPYDTTATVQQRTVIQYRNPADTVIGVSFAQFREDDRGNEYMYYGYDGTVRMVAYPEDSQMVADNFTYSVVPFRFVSTPFMDTAENIIRYALETGDSITTSFEDLGTEYLFRLAINEETQIEFFGPARRMPDNPYLTDPTGVYQIWIAKSDGMPYRIRREMEHNTTDITVADVWLNRLSAEDFNLYDLVPEGYSFREYGVRGQEPRLMSALTAGERAPEWTLEDADGRSYSLSQTTARVVMLNFTGIGCGPCLAAIPTLNALVGEFAEELELVVIESWGAKPAALRNYAEKNGMTYKFLHGTDEVLDLYLTGRGVPVYYILDSGHTVTEVLNGFTPGMTDAMMRDAIGRIL